MVGMVGELTHTPLGMARENLVRMLYGGAEWDLRVDFRCHNTSLPLLKNVATARQASAR